ncbi:MAG: tRNA pseudouridine(55) synthase TruB [Proteobacteria bacterium]|nr:tRNA pseudouridine(55) synthase TruB [Pseudomonadota bacterium]
MTSFLHGWLPLDKPYGISSTQALTRLKHFVHQTFFSSFKKMPLKIGHGGTLDPLATGVLPIALGEATKTVDYVMGSSKEYLFEVTWGERRTTDDKEGEILEVSSLRPSATQILSVLPSFTGLISQRPPLYSALKIKGVPSYKLARSGEDVILSERIIKIETLTLLDAKIDSATFFVRCGKGTYIRSIARDLAKTLGTCGYVSSLKRTKVGLFDLSCTISLDNLERVGHKISENLFSLDAVLDDIPAVSVSEKEALALKQGQKVNLSERPQLLSKGEGTLVVVKTEGKNIIGFGHYDVPLMSLHLKRGFNLD